MRGRKPIPTHIRVINGTLGNVTQNPDEPVPTGDLTEPPDWLSTLQKQIWRDAIKSAPPGLLKELDASVFTVWVVACASHQKAAVMVAKHGEVIKAPVTGVPMQSPFVSVQNKQAQIMLKAASEMGFSPTARSRVRVAGSGSRRRNSFADLQELPN